MEGFESVPMANNVPVAVGPAVSITEGVADFKDGAKEVNNATEKPDFQNDAQSDQPKQEGEVAGKLFEFAKNDGADVALEKFAKGGFDDESKDEIKENASLFQGEVEQVTNKTESSPLEQKVTALENKVSDLLSENKELTERLEKTEKRLDIALQTANDLVELIKRILAEKEMTDEEKAGFLEILFDLMVKLMQAMFVLNKDDGVMQGVSAEEQKEKDEKMFDMLGRVEKKAA